MCLKQTDRPVRSNRKLAENKTTEPPKRPQFTNVTGSEVIDGGKEVA